MEIFKDIPNYEGLYQVSNLGNVKSLNYRGNGGQQNLSQGTTQSGYRFVTLSKDKNYTFFTVHKLMSITFFNYTPTRQMVVDHINNIKTDNRLENLQVITARENTSKDRKGKSRFTGVSWNKQMSKWYCTIMIDGKNTFLGLFNCELKAAKKYQEVLATIKTD
jgi:hypothetical protein